MKRLVALFGIMTLTVLFICAAAQENPTVTEAVVGTVSVPADTTIITVSAEGNNQNTTLAAAQAQDKLNAAEDALIAAGVQKEEILSGQASGTSSFQYSSRVCRSVNNTTICDVTNNAANKVTRSFSVQVKTTDQSRINGIIDTAKSAGASASVTGYSLSDYSSAAADARKKAIDDAKSRAQEDAASIGYSLGKPIDVSVSPPYISPSDRSGFVDVNSYVIATYEVVG
jgi:uncharacterized protein YggE